MTHAAVEFAIILLSIVAVIRVSPNIGNYLRDSSTRWTACGVLVFCLGGFISEMKLTPEATTFKLLYTLAFVLGILSPLVSKSVTPRRAISSSTTVLALLLAAWLSVVNIRENYTTLGDEALLVRLAPCLIWTALLLVRDRSPLDRHMLATMVTFAFGISGILLPLADDAWRSCDATKCGVFGGMLTGLYESENFMGLQSAIVLALHLVTFGYKKSAYLIPLGVLWLLATESRTAQYALAISVLITLLLGFGRVAIKSTSTRPDGVAKRVLLGLVPICFALVAKHLVMTSQRGDFSGRGWVWMNVVNVLHGRDIVGLGIDSWEIDQRAGLLPPNLYAHSIFVLLAFSGGIVAVAIFTLLMWQALVSALRHDGVMAPGLVVGSCVLVLGLLEVVWNPVGIDGMAWIPLALVLTSAQQQGFRFASATPEVARRQLVKAQGEGGPW